MRKRILLALIFLGIFISVIGCGSTISANEEKQETNFYLEKVGNSKDVYEYRDTETGVHYLIYSESRIGYVNYSGLCPRYNADGTIYVD